MATKKRRAKRSAPDPLDAAIDAWFTLVGEAVGCTTEAAAKSVVARAKAATRPVDLVPEEDDLRRILVLGAHDRFRERLDERIAELGAGSPVARQLHALRAHVWPEEQP